MYLRYTDSLVSLSPHVCVCKKNFDIKVTCIEGEI